MARINISISDELKKAYEELSKETGASQSALIAIALKDYIDQKKAINTMALMMEKMKSMEEMGINLNHLVK